MKVNIPRAIIEYLMDHDEALADVGARARRMLDLAPDTDVTEDAQFWEVFTLILKQDIVAAANQLIIKAGDLLVVTAGFANGPLSKVVLTATADNEADIVLGKEIVDKAFTDRMHNGHDGYYLCHGAIDAIRDMTLAQSDDSAANLAELTDRLNRT